MTIGLWYDMVISYLAVELFIMLCDCVLFFIVKREMEIRIFISIFIQFVHWCVCV